MRGPGGYVVQIVERRCVAGELSQKYGRTLDRFHRSPPYDYCLAWSRICLDDATDAAVNEDNFTDENNG
jgi:hypothetical protein